MASIVRSSCSRFVNAVKCPETGWKTTHFWGPVANWGISLAAVYDLTTKGADTISIPMTSSLCIYSVLFMRFAWLVQPRNYILLGCHAFNESVQLVQLTRAINHKRSQGEEIVSKETIETAKKVAMCAPVAATSSIAALGTAIFFPGIVPRIQARVTSLPLPGKVKSLLNHPAGPFTVFFWAPTWKWMLSVSNLMDYNKPVEKISTAQQIALASTGLIWMRWSMIITPRNYNLCIVNGALALTSCYQLGRKFLANNEKTA